MKLTNNEEIAKKVAEIAKQNNLKNNGSNIFVGQKLSLPGDSFYRSLDSRTTIGLIVDTPREPLVIRESSKQTPPPTPKIKNPYVSTNKVSDKQLRTLMFLKNSEETQRI